jgi:zinc protease
MSVYRLLESFWKEPVDRHVLPNGLTLIVRPDRSAALASVQVWVKSGSVHEDRLLGAGLSHYLEHMLFKGTERRAGREISATVQAHGGYINAYTTFDRTVYYIDLPSEHVGVALDLLSDAVLRSTLPEGEAAKEKEVILREIAMTRDDPDDRLWESVFANAFREHPYRYPVIGHRELFEQVTHAELSAYYRARYVPNNLVVVVVGDVEPAAVLRQVAADFGSFPRGRLAPVLIPDEPAQLGPRDYHATEAVEIARGSVCWQVPGLTHADAPVLDLLSMVLGHGDSSILWQELREKAGLVHTVDASCWNPGTSGLFCVAFTAEPDKRRAALAAIEQILRKYAVKGFTAAQVRQALRQLISGEVAARQTMSGQAARLGSAEVVAGDLQFSRSYFERVRQIEPADLKRVLRQYCQDRGRTTVTTSPPAPAAAAAAAPAVAALSDFAETKLPNGARLLLQHEPRLPQLHFRLAWQGGTAQEDPLKRGATTLMSTVLSKDTKARSAAAVARAIESVGGSFYPFSGNHSFGLAMEVLSSDWQRAVTLLSEAALTPAFKASTVATEREAQVAGLRQDLDDVVTAARNDLRRRFFGSHPLAYGAAGEATMAAQLKAADLTALFRQLNVGGNVVLAVAGDFDRKKLPAALKAFLARFPKGNVPMPRAGAPGTTRSTSRPAAILPAVIGDFTEKQAKEQAVVLRGYAGPAANTPDYWISEVADELFSGMASRLFERVREEKGLAYFVRSARITGLDAGMFSFLAGTQPGREAEVLAEIDAEIARVAGGGVEPAELARCQARLKAGRRQGLQTNSARAMQAALSALQGLPMDDWRRYDARIDAVTIADLASFAQRYFARERSTQLVVGP